MNRLAWNEDGSLLASGSDDRQVNRPLPTKRDYCWQHDDTALGSNTRGACCVISNPLMRFMLCSFPEDSSLSLPQVLLWSYPDVDKTPLALQTEHAANIFGVQFMPRTNNSQIITGSMDDTVMLHHVDRLSTQLSRRGSSSTTPVASQSTLYGCHRARVKVCAPWNDTIWVC